MPLEERATFLVFWLQGERKSLSEGQVVGNSLV